MSRDFLPLVYYINQFPPAPEYSIRTVSNFFEISRRFSQFKVHRRQIVSPVSQVLLISVANLPPMSTIPAANLPPVSTTPVANCHRYCHRWQIMRTMPGCRHLKVNLKAKIYTYDNICHRYQWHRWYTLSCEYLREFSKKFETALMVYSGAWGKLIHEKNQKSKISWHCRFQSNFSTRSLNFT